MKSLVDNLALGKLLMPFSLKRNSRLQPVATDDIAIDGYYQFEKIFESQRSRIFRARSQQKSGATVVLKILQEEFLERSEIARYKNQFEILSTKPLSCSPKVLALDKFHNLPVLIFEDIGATSLRSFLQHRPVTIREAILISKLIAECLLEIHANDIIHKDLNPANILYLEHEQKIKIIDFGISTLLPREHIQRAQTVMEGSLAYMSPEQTGRLNRYLDYRTDLYSLGVTMYELLVGRLPFQSEDPLQLIHFHIAKKPIPPHDIDEQIPPVLSKIVVKLLEKDADHRYQSSWGLLKDLEKCWQEYEAKQRIDAFPLGLQDISDKFHLPNQLYGRQRELALLEAALHETSAGASHLVMVGGALGVGKSSLGRELNRSVNERRGFFLQGHYDELDRSVPYRALSQALQDLVKQILSLDEYTLQRWRQKLLALGPNLDVIQALVPQFSLISGRQTVQHFELGPQENENRFRETILRFFELIADADAPVILYLDDLQWADQRSLQLIRYVTEYSQLNYWLIILSYRSDLSTHSLSRLYEFAEELQTRHHYHFHHIKLEPLSVEQLSDLIADTLHTPVSRARELAAIVHQKTGGTPLFVDEFMRSINRDKLLYFDAKRGSWDWDQQQIRLCEMADNVAQIMARKIDRLSDSCRNLIKRAACIGSEFRLGLLHKIIADQNERPVEDLRQAITEGLIVAVGDSFRQIEMGLLNIQDATDVEFRFSHDRLHEAARNLMPTEERKRIRGRIGLVLLHEMQTFGREELIFSVVGHLNDSPDFLNHGDNRQKLIRLNLTAAEKAKASTAYEIARELLEFTIDKLIYQDDWQSNYEVTLQCYSLLTETCFLLGNFSDMEDLGRRVLQRPIPLLDKVPIYETMVHAAISKDDMKRAVQIGKDVLRQLGSHVPNRPSLIRILWEFFRTRIALMGKRPQVLLNLPKLSSPRHLAQIHFQYTLTQCIFLYMPRQVPISICEALRISIKHGNAPTSALVYTTYGILQAGVFGRYRTGYAFGELGCRLIEQLGARDVEAATLVSFNLYLRPWRDPLRATLPSLRRAFQAGLETGDHEFAAHAAMGYCYRSFLAGFDLPDLQEEMLEYRLSLQHMSYHGNSYIHDLYLQIVDCLRSESLEIQNGRLKGPYYDEDRMLARHRSQSDAAGVFLTFFGKLTLAYLFGADDEAWKSCQEGERSFKAGMGTYNHTVFEFYKALCLLRRLPEARGSESRQYWRQIKQIQRKYRRWAKHCPQNFAGKLWLLEAEICALKRRSFRAQVLYDEAIQQSKQSGFQQDEALANELAAIFHLKQQRTTISAAYLKRARLAYGRWGAVAKVRQLEERYPQILQYQVGERSLTNSLTTMSSSTIDLTTLKKALLAIAEETIHSRMLEKIILSAMEFAGAQKGALLLKKDDEFFIEAEGVIDQDVPKILQSIPLDQSDNICISVVNYVKRTGSVVVIENAQQPQDLIPNLAQDTYVQRHQVYSILCIPISVRANESSSTIGMLYLENNQTAAVFTEERIETLEIICLSAAGRLELSVRAATDGLTGLYNHDYFQSMLEKEILKSQRQQRNLSLIMIDIDHFKSFNDKWGHQVGDMVLKHVAEVLKEACRKSDIVARYGGEELSVILPETSPDLAKIVAERIRQTVENERVPHGDEQLQVTVSVGVSFLQESVRTSQTLVERADQALYLSKHNGRNRVTMA